MKKIMVICTSLHHNSNSEILADAFVRGAKEAGHQVEKITLAGKKINFCTGCLVCQKTQRCVIRDDADSIVQAMKDMDILVFATPVYYYEMAGQMKTLLDRANPLYPADYAFRDIYLLASSAEKEKSAMDGPVHGLEGWIRCFPKCQLAGVARGTGVTEPGEMANNPVAIQEAYTLGKNA